MKITVWCLASAIALCLVLPYCTARPGAVSVKKETSQQASVSASAEEESSEQVVKKGGCGCGGGASYSASKKKSSKAAKASSSSSSSSYQAKKVDDSCTSLTEAQIKEKYARRSGESLDVYYKRILSRSYTWTKTREAYIKTLSLVWKDFNTLDLWYSRKYIDLIRDFYIDYYAKQESESWESYYSRIVKKEEWETEYQFARRIGLVRDCFPTLELWLSDQWFDKYTKSLYALEFKKFEKESEADWVKRIFERDTFFDTTDYIWAKRLYYIEKATISSCSVWYNKQYLSYFKKFYEIYYKKAESETCDGWLLRALTPFPGEDYGQAITRIKFIKEVTGDCGCWKAEYFKKIQEAKSFQDDWLVKVRKAFFPCGCGGAVTVQRSSSSKSSAASSASASESSDYLVKSG